MFRTHLNFQVLARPRPPQCQCQRQQHQTASSFTTTTIYHRAREPERGLSNKYDIRRITHTHTHTHTTHTYIFGHSPTYLSSPLNTTLPVRVRESHDTKQKVRLAPRPQGLIRQFPARRPTFDHHFRLGLLSLALALSCPINPFPPPGPEQRASSRILSPIDYQVNLPQGKAIKASEKRWLAHLSNCQIPQAPPLSRTATAGDR